ncbi:Protein of unknown function [Pseudomonas helmanticensis]|uniref:Uncharacterized protein n=1 Tax=Pseudomonas helmanticensis TaxID=1471381 RepID=A0ACD2UCZ1_9PSED|nr:DUF2790 domain-containing protein [Pseudomonas helmanticensis]SMQ30375.1 Protein of unknown function [Pseudomonas helmanticensis]
MNKILFLALSLTASLSAYAQDSTESQPVVVYSYGMHVDVAKVIHITPAADTCFSTPVQMTYDDSRGGVHVLEYSVIGTGCTN